MVHESVSEKDAGHKPGSMDLWRNGLWHILRRNNAHTRTCRRMKAPADSDCSVHIRHLLLPRKCLPFVILSILSRNDDEGGFVKNVRRC